MPVRNIKTLTAALAGTALCASLAGAPAAGAATVHNGAEEGHQAAAANLVITNIYCVRDTNEPGDDGDEVYFTLNNGASPPKNAAEDLHSGQGADVWIPLTAGDTVQMFEDDPVGDDEIDSRRITQAGPDWKFNNNGSYLVDIARA